MLQSSDDAAVTDSATAPAADPRRFRRLRTQVFNRLTAPTDDGSIVPVTTLHAGSFLGQTTLTRQSLLANATALGEVTALQITREHLEHLLQRKPSLLQEFGRLIEDRRSHVKRALAAVND